MVGFGENYWRVGEVGNEEVKLSWWGLGKTTGGWGKEEMWMYRWWGLGKTWRRRGVGYGQSCYLTYKSTVYNHLAGIETPCGYVYQGWRKTKNPE